MSTAFQKDVIALDAALDTRPLDYETLIAVFRKMTLPASPDAGTLTRLLDCCYRILDFGKTGFGQRLREDVGDWRAGHLEACAGQQAEQIMFDSSAQSRAWIAERIAWHQENELEVPEDYLNNDLPPALHVPWDKPTARQRIAPLLAYWQGALADNPTAHFSLAWKVLHDGYPVFRTIMQDWMRELDERGIGLPGTLAAFSKADDLLKLAQSEQPQPWSLCERDLVPLLRDPHPMIAAGAARALGSFYADGGFANAPDAPSLRAMLETLSDLEDYRALACGGFVCGLDTEFAGLSTLQSDPRLDPTGFVLDDWILKIVAHDDYEPYLPNAQPIWFYIHEHYDTKPDMVMKFIAMGRSWLAMMCATEVHDTVPGMKPVLERLAKDIAPDVARAASQHLAAHYGA